MGGESLAFYILFNVNTGNYVVEMGKFYDYSKYDLIEWINNDTIRVYFKNMLDLNSYILKLRDFSINYHNDCINKLLQIQIK